MRNKLILPTIIVGGTALVACSMQPEKNSMLEDAHSGYSLAQSNSDVTNLAAVELQEAGKALDKADDAQKKREDSEVVDHLAYLAKQRVAIAEQTANLKVAEVAVEDTNTVRDKVRLQLRTAEADASRQKIATAQETARINANDLATANASAELSRQNLAAQSAEADKQALMAKESSEQSAVELAAANARVSAMETELKDLNAKKTARGLVITLGDVLFDINKADLRPKGNVSIQKLADFFHEYPERKVLIEGFTDSTGSDNYNQDLSDHRANTVRDTLIHMGINGTRIITRGYGKEYPVASNLTTAGRQLNRRVEIVLSDEDGNITPR